MDRQIKIFQSRIRVIIWLVLAGSILWIMYRGLALSGKIVYRYAPDKSGYFISKPSPDTRVEVSSEKSLFVFGDPVYFSLYTPRAFESMRVNILFKRFGDPTKTPIIETGILADKDAWRYDLKPINNSYLDELIGEWDLQKEGGTLFVQRENRYASISEFFMREKDISGQTAVYNRDIGIEYLLPGYAPSRQERKIKPSLRGGYQFYTYLKDEELDFNFDFSDLNLDKDDDPVEVLLSKNGRVIASRRLEGDADAADTGHLRDIGSAQITAKDLPEGAYKLEVKAGGDIVTRVIQTTQSKISFINRIRLCSDSKMTVYADMASFSYSTDNPSAIGRIQAGSNALMIPETYKKFDFTLPDNPTAISLETADAELSGPGCFAFKESELLDPEIGKVSLGFPGIKDRINFVIADYQPPESEGEWMSGSADISLASAYRENFRYNLILSVPGLKAEDRSRSGIEIKEISLVYKGKINWRHLAKEIIRDRK